jgi:uncharacterized protein
MLLVDTNIWLAAADRSSRDHQACATLLASHTSTLASTVPVIAETAWLLLDRAGPQAQHRFLATITGGALEPIAPTTGDWARITELCDTYSDISLDIIDASTIAAAERLGHTTIATLDHRDFRIVRPAHTDAFDLIPQPT